MSSIFYALLCWKMASDRTYWKNLIWIPITAMVLPLAIWLSNILFNKYYFRGGNQNSDVDNNQSHGDDEASDHHSVWHWSMSQAITYLVTSSF
jgi:hypothetical protein